MSTIQITKPHDLGRPEAHRRVNELESELLRDYGVRLHWHGDEADVQAEHVEGRLVVGDAELSLSLKLGLLLTPLQGKIRSSLEERIDHALASRVKYWSTARSAG